ncbi:MAG: class I SAM-dependent methyltransferase, partial [Candidatus Dojkabacteria bacterium]
MQDQQQLWDTKHASDSLEIYEPSEHIIELVKHFPSKGKVLELGCGKGYDANFLAEKGFDVLAVDFSQAVIDMNRKRFNEQDNLAFDQLDTRNVGNLGKDSYDVVYARLSLHYFNNSETKQIFRDIHKVLKKGGFLVFICKSTKDAKFGKGKEIEPNMFESEGHLRHFFSKNYA